MRQDSLHRVPSTGHPLCFSFCFPTPIMSRDTRNKPRNKSYPRSTIKKIIKGHSDKNVGRNVDALVRTGCHHLNTAQQLSLRKRYTLILFSSYKSQYYLSCSASNAPLANSAQADAECFPQGSCQWRKENSRERYKEGHDGEQSTSMPAPIC